MAWPALGQNVAGSQIGKGLPKLGIKKPSVKRDPKLARMALVAGMKGC